MNLSLQEITDLVAELAGVLPGQFLDKVHSPEPTQCQLAFRQRVLLLELAPGRCRLHLVERRRPGPPTPPGWVMKARSELLGRPLRAITALAGERAVRLDFEGSARRPARALLAELFGHRPRLLLLDETDQVLHPLLGEAEVGATYQPPCPAPAPRGAPSRFPAPDPATLAANRAAELHFAEQDTGLTREKARRELARRLGAERARLARRLSKIEADARHTLEAEQLAHQAEVLKLHLGAVRRGQSRLELPDPWSEQAGALISIELDPARGPVENMQRLFSRARRLTAARGSITGRLEATRARLVELDALLAQLLALDSAEQLEDLRRQLEQPGAPATRAAARPGRRQPYRLYLSASGRTILVGRSGKDNHKLTFQIAHGADMWFHTRDAAGAHVVVRLERGEEIDEQTLLDAATLAAWSSPLRSADKVDVTYTRASNVHPIKGAAPGLVSVSRAKTLLIRIEPDRLNRLEKSRN